ncbi:SigE family RNA polymerase sigma factor [Actinoplanes derwentensis]|uniref:RNA polymerase sigma-70 factor, sigma-E family n=1 Tax=Actinoplanes derwentensis TaxID=113562 RepID=A0A1H2CTP3_9ACTN|nr:SigE family RNA polymerase sigma factor [Actinoplanes derwentensis]GID81849.1 RNA polymerase sigma24 factor [Actinoplanes derwentensis]SDT73843.1 RNA polymerase sigma-70 factor, sigma-E family [Actinoplanes derwentensis]
MHADLEERFRAMVAAEHLPLRRFARSLTRDTHRADDLVQSAMEKMYVAWPRTHNVAEAGAYLRTIVIRQAVSESRRPWRREYSAEVLPDAGQVDGVPSAMLRYDLAQALTTLTVKQRAIVVLRYVEDRGVQEVAEMMGIAPGTVKRQSADAVAKLRRVLGEDFADDAPENRPGSPTVTATPGGNR